MMTELQEKIWDALCDLGSAEDVARAFTNFLGNAVLDEEFAEFLDYEYGTDILDEEEM